MLDAVANASIIAGALLCLLAAVAVLRFDDPLARMSALGKASTLGVALLMIGAIVLVPGTASTSKLLITVALQWITTPIAVFLVARAAYDRADPPVELDGVDELAEAREAAEGQEAARPDPG